MTLLITESMLGKLINLILIFVANFKSKSYFVIAPKVGKCKFQGLGARKGSNGGSPCGWLYG